MRSAPLRFLLLVLGLWIGVRASILLPDWLIPEAPATPSRPGPASPVTPVVATPSPVPATVHTDVAQKVQRPLMRAGSPPLDELSANGTAAPAPVVQAIAQGAPVVPGKSAPVPTPHNVRASFPPLSLPPPLAASHSPWSLSGWVLVRREAGGDALAPGGTLGGSQAGARLSYALGGGLSLGARVYLPLRRTAGAELAAGIDWRPLPAIPVNLLAERRQRIGREGRAAFALTVYGGATRALTPRLRVDLYGQAGAVGLRSRDPFVDGSLRLARRVGALELGAGAWGAAQPGAVRLDAGPSLSWRLPVPRANLRLQADWRFRLAGDAAPRSGPALTIATDF